MLANMFNFSQNVDGSQYIDVSQYVWFETRPSISYEVDWACLIQKKTFLIY